MAKGKTRFLYLCMIFMSKQGVKLTPFPRLPKQCAMGGDKPVEGMCCFCGLQTFYIALQDFQNPEGLLFIGVVFISEQVLRYH